MSDEKFIPECDFCDSEFHVNSKDEIVDEYGDLTKIIQCEDCQRYICSKHIWWSKQRKHDNYVRIVCANCKFSFKKLFFQ